MAIPLNMIAVFLLQKKLTLPRVNKNSVMTKLNKIEYDNKNQSLNIGKIRDIHPHNYYITPHIDIFPLKGLFSGLDWKTVAITILFLIFLLLRQ